MLGFLIFRHQSPKGVEAGEVSNPQVARSDIGLAALSRAWELKVPKPFYL